MSEIPWKEKGGEGEGVVGERERERERERDESAALRPNTDGDEVENHKKRSVTAIAATITTGGGLKRRDGTFKMNGELRTSYMDAEIVSEFDTES